MSALPLICGAPSDGDATHTEKGRPTLDYFKRCHAVIFDVSKFANLVIEGTEMDLFSTIEGMLALRKAFAALPTACRIVELAFEETIAEEIESWRERFEALSKPLPDSVPTLEELDA